MEKLDTNVILLTNFGEIWEFLTYFGEQFLNGVKTIDE